VLQLLLCIVKITVMMRLAYVACHTGCTDVFNSPATP
jgi:hypothetical protein